jgi:NAD(P)H-flavin reductase
MINPYKVEMVKIKEIREEALGTKTFVLDKKLDFNPGQFILVSKLGIGECAISISSYPDLEISFKSVGNVTNALFGVKSNQKIGIRGPYGVPYPLDDLKGKNIILIAGGIGLAPIRALIKYYLLNPDYFSSITLFFGAKTPEFIPFKKDIEKWEKIFPIHLTVDYGNKEWKGNVGLVTSLLEKFNLPNNSVAIFCGPPIMFKFTAEILNKKGMKNEDMIVSLERNMRCGIGKCGHCSINGKFVCTNGPNFRWSEIIECNAHC